MIYWSLELLVDQFHMIPKWQILLMLFYVLSSLSVKGPWRQHQGSVTRFPCLAAWRASPFSAQIESVHADICSPFISEYLLLWLAHTRSTGFCCSEQKQTCLELNAHFALGGERQGLRRKRKEGTHSPSVDLHLKVKQVCQTGKLTWGISYWDDGWTENQTTDNEATQMFAEQEVTVTPKALGPKENKTTPPACPQWEWLLGVSQTWKEARLLPEAPPKANRNRKKHPGVGVRKWDNQN